MGVASLVGTPGAISREVPWYLRSGYELPRRDLLRGLLLSVARHLYGASTVRRCSKRTTVYSHSETDSQVLLPKYRANRVVRNDSLAKDTSSFLATQVLSSDQDVYLDLGSVIASSTQSSPLKSWFVFLQRVAGKPFRPSDEAFLAPSLLLERLVLGGFAGNTCVELSTLPRGVRVGLE